MPDQAEGLRELVAGQKGESLVTHDKEGRPIFTQAGLDFMNSEPVPEDWLPADLLREYAIHDGPDKAALWDSLKSDLEHEADRHYQDSANKWHGDGVKAEAALAMLDRMLRMEEIAKPADAETFARVKSDMGASRG